MTDCKHRRSKTLSLRRATVTDGMLKIGYTSVTFVDLGVKVNGTYYCELLLSQQLLPAICHVSSKFVFKKNSATAYRACYVIRY